jgi:hypothetical protein
MPGTLVVSSVAPASSARAAKAASVLREPVNRARKYSMRSGNVLAPLAERRHFNMDNVDSVEEVLAELTQLDQFTEVAVGRRHDAHVRGANSPLGADLLDFTGFQVTQQKSLHAQRHLADFVEEDRAVVGHLELAGFVPVGAREAALHMAEQLRFEQRFRNAGAVDGHERLGS